MNDAGHGPHLPFPLVTRGKVREVYDVGADRLLMVASDRISAFDVVMQEPIPGKGFILTQLTAWWLARLDGAAPHHLISADPAFIAREVPQLADDPHGYWAGRTMLVHRTAPIPVECVVRGYLAGSAWAEYRRQGTLVNEPLPPGMVKGQRLEPPLFSPATKAHEGHDENITFSQVCSELGHEVARLLRSRSHHLFHQGRIMSEEAGIILADTKFEFGQHPDGRILLIDEVLTPDSSRYWPRDQYEPGKTAPSLDKQPVRDYLEDLVTQGHWNRSPPPPQLTPRVVDETVGRYRDLFRRLTGFTPESFPVDAPGTEPPLHRRSAPRPAP